jgi:hypothetical protein
MFEFKRVTIDSLTSKQVGYGMAELEHLGRDGWQIKAAIRSLTGNVEVVYLEREVEE